MKYQNVKNGQIGTVVEENTKFKTVTLKMEDGSTRSYSSSTIKRWWKEVSEEPKMVPMPGTEGDWGEKHRGNAEEEKAGDGTPYKQVMQEIIADEKKHVEEVMRQKKELGIEVTPITEVTVVEENGKKVNKTLKLDDRKFIMDDITETLDKNGVEYVTYPKMPNMMVIRCGKKSVFELRVKKSGVTFNCREQDMPKKVEFHKVNNYYMPIVINATKDTWPGVFRSLLDSIDNYRKEA